MRMQRVHPHFYSKIIRLDYAGARGSLGKQGRWRLDGMQRMFRANQRRHVPERAAIRETFSASFELPVQFGTGIDSRARDDRRRHHSLSRSGGAPAGVRFVPRAKLFPRRFPGSPLGVGRLRMLERGRRPVNGRRRR